MSFNGPKGGVKTLIDKTCVWTKSDACTSTKQGNMVPPYALGFQAAGRRFLRPLQSKMPSQSASSVSKIREAHRILMSFSACEPFACSLFQRVVPVKSCHLKGKNSYKHPENGLNADVFK
jgi:hypothetical protein